MSIAAEALMAADEQKVAAIQCVCGSTDVEDWGPCRIPASSRLSERETLLSQQLEPGHLYRCRQCLLGLRLPRPDIQALEELYSAMKSDRWKNKELLGTAQSRVINAISHGRPSRIRVLDVGAFNGRFLAALPPHLEKYAIEPSTGGQQTLSDRGIKILKPFLEPAAADECEQFDVVTMFDVFEHLSDPSGGMQALMSYVKPGGSLFVGTANLDHWSWRATKGNHWYLDSIQHIVVGSRSYFERLQHQLPPSLLRICNLSHQDGSFSERIRQTAQMIYFGARNQTGNAGVCLRMMHTVPFFRRLAHKETVPYTQYLRDHLLAEFIRLEATR